MSISKEFLFFFSCLGIFNGLLLSSYFLFFSKKKHVANYFLAALILMISIRIAKSSLLYFHHELPKIYLQIGLSACFLIGPLLYYFICAATGKHTVLKSWKWTIGFCVVLLLSIGIPFGYQQHPQLWGLFVKIIYAQWLLFILLSVPMLKNTIQRLFVGEERTTLSERWTCSIFLGNVGIFIFYVLALFNIPFVSYILGAILFSFVAYLAIFVLMYRKRTDDLFAQLPERASGKRMNTEEADRLLTKIQKLMEEQKPYQDADLKLAGLASMLNTSAHQLSLLLNAHLNRSFTTYINEFRIKDACKYIKSKPNITLEQIGYEVGFNSKSTFFAAFKKITGTTPAAYQNSTEL